MKVTTDRYYDGDGKMIGIELEALDTRWNTNANCVSLVTKEVGDFSPEPGPRWKIDLSLQEIGMIVEKLGAASIDLCPDELSTVFGPRLLALARLASVCVWPNRASAVAAND